MGGNVRNGECVGIVHCAHGSFFNSDQRDRNQPGRFEPESNGYFDGKPRGRGDTKSRASGPGTACSFAGRAKVISFSLYRSTISGSSYGLLASALGTAAYNDQSVQSGTIYYYVVTAVDDQGRESALSNETRATVP